MPPLDAAWQQKLAALRAYVAAHGRLPPQRDASGLGVWVNSQRRGKKALDSNKTGKVLFGMTPARAAALEAVPGWAWEVDAEAAWEAKLAALRAHVAAHRRLPLRYDASSLGAWVHNQRQAKKAMDTRRRSKSGTMTPARVAALEGVPGWAWEVDLEAAWQEKIAALRAYVAAHGRLPPQRDASGLGRWVSNQRQAKKAADAGRECSHKMTPARAAALEAVPGWAWELDLEALWQEQLAALRAHVASHGRLPPQRDASGLGGWARNQRQAKKALDLNKTGEALRGMTSARAVALEGVPGWTWEVDLEALWQEKLAALRAYVDAHGRLPLLDDPSGLGDWIHGQRDAKKAGKKRMTPARAAALEGVPGWAWEVDFEALWQERLAALRAHVAAHGRLPQHRGAGLGNWVTHQRQAKKAMDAGSKSKTMTLLRAAALEAVPGWAWEVDLELAWLQKLAALRAYVSAHGRLPPKGDASGLGDWVSNQRQAKAGNTCKLMMTPARVAALEAVPGWAWGGRRRAAAPAAPPAKRAKMV